MEDKIEEIARAMRANLRTEPVPNTMYDWRIEADSVDEAARAAYEVMTRSDGDAILRELDLVAPNIRASHGNTVFTRDEIMRAFKRYAALTQSSVQPDCHD